MTLLVLSAVEQRPDVVRPSQRAPGHGASLMSPHLSGDRGVGETLRGWRDERALAAVSVAAKRGVGWGEAGRSGWLAGPGAGRRSATSGLRRDGHRAAAQLPPLVAGAFDRRARPIQAPQLAQPPEALGGRGRCWEPCR